MSKGKIIPPLSRSITVLHCTVLFALESTHRVLFPAPTCIEKIVQKLSVGA